MYKYLSIIPAMLLAFVVLFSGFAQANDEDAPKDEKLLLVLVESGDIGEARQFFLNNPGGYDINARTPLGGTYLHAAAMQPKAEMLQLLIDHGYLVNAVDEDGETPLHAAVGANNLEAVRIMIENGANQTIEDSHGMTALDRAVKSNRADIVSYLRNPAPTASN